VLIGAVPPSLVKSATNPEGIPLEVFDGLRSGPARDRSPVLERLRPSCSRTAIDQMRNFHKGC